MNKTRLILFSLEVDKQKFLQIIDDNNNRLRHLCKVYASNSSDEDDLYQEVVLQLWRSLPRFQGNSKLSTWMYRVALNVSISFVRKRDSRRKYYRAYKKENEFEHLNEPERFGESGIRMKQLYQAISQLNTSEKALITMYLEDFTYTEIAEVVDITENYVGVKLNRIKEKLSQIIKESYGI